VLFAAYPCSLCLDSTFTVKSIVFTLDIAESSVRDGEEDGGLRNGGIAKEVPK